MKPVITLIILLSFGVSSFAESSIPFREKIIGLYSRDGVYRIGGSSVGYGGSLDPFYLLAQRVLKEGSEEEFRSMLKDNNPAVRAMGIVCLAKKEKEFPYLIGDRAKVDAFPGGCSGERMSLFEFSRRLKRDQNFKRGFVIEVEDEIHIFEDFQQTKDSLNLSDFEKFNPEQK